MNKNLMGYFPILLSFICLSFGSTAQNLIRPVNNQSQNTNQTHQKGLSPQKILKSIEQTTSQSIQAVSSKVAQYRAKLLEIYQQNFDKILTELNSLRNPYFQYRTYLAAKKLEGINLYHDYGSKITQKNDDENTCVNGWCQVMSETGMPVLSQVANGTITFFRNTVAEERIKTKPNLWQKRPKYIHVGELIENAEEMGFLPIDLDLAQRGDFSIQYYRKQRGENEPTFAPQHVSIVDMIIPWGNGMFELRDWHEGIENEPFVYRTATNMSSSFNNIFHPVNVYYGFQDDRGKERPLYGKNPNICQAYAYFGTNIERARELIKEINYIRGQIYMLENLQARSKAEDKK